MGKLDLAKVSRDVGITLKRRSPEILTGVGIAGMVTTTVLAVKATPRALILIEEEKRRQNHELLEEAKVNGYEQCEQITELRPLELVRATWKCYLPTVVTGAVSIFCLVGASSVNVRRNAALATAYTLSESVLKEYKAKVTETIGEKKERAVRDSIAKDRIEKNPMVPGEVIITGKGTTKCYDVLSGRYFDSSIEEIKKAINEINRRLLNQSYVSLNEFYYEIGLAGNKTGNLIGWTIDQSLIEADFSAQISEDGTPCIVIDFENMPRYDFDRFL